MLTLPILNVHLQTCPESWQQMTPTPQGRHCAHCNRTVVDFTHATAADLEAARAAAPDGRLCGRFRQSQLADSRPQLRPKLRRFLVALVLVCGLGLTSKEAWAQVRAVGSRTAPEQMVFGGVESMPEYPGGTKALLQLVANNAHYPKGATKSGKVFVRFVITKAGKVDSIQIAKGVEPLLDAEAVRLMQLMPCWKPGEQNHLPVDVHYTFPITFVSPTTSTPSFSSESKK